MIQQIDFNVGDVVRVHTKIQETDAKGNPRARVQIFEGTVLSIKGRDENKSFTVRKMVGDVAVERIWPVFSPNVEKVTLKAKPKHRVRKAKLYNLRTAK
ncbi:MAG: 50S ribosomal protein L19 [Candidatus Levybacteria bacterium]|nr:50S ribosomal protein L19 [Candidatus Levybacteria bacterium]